MIVVMVLLGLLTTLALPALQRWHDAIQVRARLATVIDALRAGAFAASAGRREWIIDESSFQSRGEIDRQSAPSAAGSTQAGNADSSSAGDDGKRRLADGAVAAAANAAPPKRANRLLVPLPAGWTVGEVVSARFLSNGLCQPGQAVLLTERGERVTVRIGGPLCSVDALRIGA